MINLSLLRNFLPFTHDITIPNGIEKQWLSIQESRGTTQCSAVWQIALSIHGKILEAMNRTHSGFREQATHSD